jgi:hypothetical protein
MKAEQVKTPQNTEEVSSHPGKKGIGAKKAIGTPPVSEKNRGRTGKKACKSGRREDNHENGKKQFIYAMNINSNGKSWLKCNLIRFFVVIYSYSTSNILAVIILA